MSQPNLLQILLIYEAVNTRIGPLIQAGALMLSEPTKLVSSWWIPLHMMCYSCSTTACSSWWNHHVDWQQMLGNSLCLHRAELPMALLMKLRWELHLVPILDPILSLEPRASALKPATSTFFSSETEVKFLQTRPVGEDGSDYSCELCGRDVLNGCSLSNFSCVGCTNTAQTPWKTHWLWDLAALHTDLCSAGGSLPLT